MPRLINKDAFINSMINMLNIEKANNTSELAIDMMNWFIELIRQYPEYKGERNNDK